MPSSGYFNVFKLKFSFLVGILIMNSNRLFKRQKRESNDAETVVTPETVLLNSHNELTILDETSNKGISTSQLETLRVIADRAISKVRFLVKPAHDALSDLIVQINRVDFSKIDHATQMKLRLFVQACRNLLAQDQKVAMNDPDFVILTDTNKKITIGDVLYDLEEMETIVSSQRKKKCSEQEIMAASIKSSLQIRLARCIECAELSMAYLTMYPVKGKASLKLPPINAKVSVELFKFLEEDHAFVVLNRTVDSMDVTDWNDDVVIVDPYAEELSYTLKEIRNASTEEREKYSIFKKLMSAPNDSLEVEYEYESFENLTIGCQDETSKNDNLVDKDDVTTKLINPHKN